MKTIIANTNPNLVALIAIRDDRDASFEDTFQVPIIGWRVEDDSLTPICADGRELERDECCAWLVFDCAAQVGYPEEGSPLHGREACIADLCREHRYQRHVRSKKRAA